MTAVTITSMHDVDWPAVRDIFVQGIAFGHATFETEPPTWEHWNAEHLSHSRFVARVDSNVVGWIAIKRVSNRMCYAGVGEVSYYIAEGNRGRGIGKQLLQAAITASEENGLWMLTAGIFPENTASCRLVEALGFRLVGRRERIGNMNGVWRDTLLYERRSRVVGTDEV